MEMSTVDAFNTLLMNFLTELAQTFPEEPGLKVGVIGAEMLSTSDPARPLAMFMETFGPHSDLIMARDPSLFDQSIDLGGHVDLSALWKKPDLSDGTRDALWQYINTLFMLGSTVQSMPAELLTTIESVAKQCADEMQASGGGMDVAGLQSMLMSSMSSIMKKK